MTPVAGREDLDGVEAVLAPGRTARTCGDALSCR